MELTKKITAKKSNDNDNGSDIKKRGKKRH